MAENSQAKIPVKKSDGSTVFMTMDEFRVYKNQGTAQSAVSSPMPLPAPVVDPSLTPSISVTPVSITSIHVPEKIKENTKPIISEPIEKPLSIEISSPVLEKKEEAVEPQSTSQPTLKPISTPEPASSIIIPTVVPISKKLESLPKALEEGKIEVIPEDPNANTPPEEALLVLSEQSLSTTTPVADAFVHESESKKTWKKEDHDSLLEEPTIDTTSSDVQTTPGTQEPSIDEKYKPIVQTVKSQFPYPIAKNLEARFDSLVVSRLKDVRTVYEVEEYAIKSTEQGGLAFNEDQAKLLNAIISAAQKLSGGGDTAPKARRPIPPPSLKNVEASAPSPAPAPASAPAPEPLRRETITKINVPESISPAAKPQGSSSSYKFPLSGEEYQFTAASSSASSSGIPRARKVMVQDVVSPSTSRKTMGPIDELHVFSLIDFRRLSPKTESAKEIMKEKFAGLQQESYVLFLDARDAWRESSLFQVYEEIVLSALEIKISIEESIANHPSGLTVPEFQSIIEINKFLG